MLRADNVVCGTTTTGTGTLTLAACPNPPGGLDFYQWLTATGLGFTNPSDVLVSYTIIEYTDATFSTAKQTEKGIGTLQIRASLTASLLVRTTVQSKVLTMNATPALTVAAPTAITIGTAANTLIFVGASAAEVLVTAPARDTALTLNGFPPIMVVNPGTGGGAGLVNNQDWTTPFMWGAAMLVKRVYFRVESIYTGAVSNLYARIYQPDSLGRQQGKLLYDFGVIGVANSSFNPGGGAFSFISSGAAGSGFLMTPGEYFLQICPIWTVSGGSGTPQLTKWANGQGPLTSGFRGATGVGLNGTQYDNSANAVAPDPAPAAAGSINDVPCFFFAAS